MYAPADQYNSQKTRKGRPLLVWTIVAAGALLFTLTILAAPLALAGNHRLLAITIYRAFGNLCHQLPERSFFIAGHQFAVCARCTGLYAGFAFSVLLYPLIRPITATVNPPRKWLFLAAVPMAFDFGLDFVGVWQNTHSSRLLTGLLLGAASAFYVMPGLVELSLRRRRNRETTRTRFTDVSAEMVASAPSDYSAPHRRI